HPRPAVGLDHEPLVDVLLGIEAVDLAGELGGVAGRVELGYPPDRVPPLAGRLPPGLRADAAGRHDSEAGQDHLAVARGEARARGRGLHQALNSMSSGGRERIMADWNPPNPLAVDRATSIWPRRAVFGV